MTTTTDEIAVAKRRMLDVHLAGRGIRPGRVLDAMARVPREIFVPDELVERAYDDTPLSIGAGQTISQPFIVALMADVADFPPGGKVLDVGTGSGYAAAILAEMGAQVFSVEIREELLLSAKARLAGRWPVTLRHGDGALGWPEEAPFDAILVSAAPETVPQPLLEQLAEGGRLVIPVGSRDQELWLFRRRGPDFESRIICGVRFVPLKRD